MADRPVTFDEPTARQLLGLLRSRRNDPQPLRQDVPSVPQTARRHRWARATTNYLAPTYPTSGNVVLVEFGEYQFTPPTSVNQTVSPTWVPYTTNPYDPGGFAFAVVPTGGTLPAEGDVVRVDLDDGVWWVRPTGGGATWPIVSMDLLGDLVYTGGTTITTSKPGGYRVAEVWGDTDRITVTVNTSRSTYTDWAFSVAEAGYYVWLWHWLTPSVSFSGAANLTYTTSTPSAGTSHTHTVDVPNDSSAMLKLQLERQAGGSGAWDFGVPAYPADQGLVRKLIKHYGIDTTLNAQHSLDAVIAESSLTAGDRWRLQLSASVSAIATASDWAWNSFGAAPVQLSLIRIGDAVTPTSY